MRQIHPFGPHQPHLARDVFVAPGAQVIGQVTVGAGSSIWFNAVLRGDVEKITIGTQTNIQDGCVCHVTTNLHALKIGDNVTIGHGAILHGCTIADGALVGMGAIVLDGAVIEPDAMVAAGATVTPRTVVTSGTLWAGTPAQQRRPLTPEEVAYLAWSAPHYAQLATQYMNPQQIHTFAHPTEH